VYYSVLGSYPVDLRAIVETDPASEDEF